ncbi:MAG: hypothetical protein WBZ20_15365 [Nitrososphaeraceae archaeon]
MVKVYDTSAWNAVTNFLIKLSLIPVAVIAPRNAQRAPIHYSLVLLRKSRKKINAMDSIIDLSTAIVFGTGILNCEHTAFRETER